MALATRKSCCIVPGCSYNSQKQPYLSFHSFPVNGETRRKWIQAIGRDEGPTFTLKKGRNYVCSRHFPPEDYFFGTTVRRLKPESVPSLFPWNDYSSKVKHESVYEWCQKQQLLTSVVEVKEIAKRALKRDHEYAMPPPAGFPADVPHGVSCKQGLKFQDHLHIKKEEEELWESLEVKQETDTTAVTVKSEKEEAQCSLLHGRQSEENIKREPATCSSGKLRKVEPNGDISEGPEAANTCKQQDTDGEETDCSGTDDSEDWTEPSSQSEAQSEHMNMSCENFQTSENNTNGTSHNIGNPLDCDLCKKLKKHTRTRPGEKSFSCEVCGKKFSRSIHLKHHMFIHVGKKPYECDVCQKRFVSKGEMDKHMRIHTGERPFGCDVCGHSFCHKGNLKVHMRIHTGEKPYSCDVCGEGYSRRVNLTVHMRIHTGVKPHNCNLCEKGYNRRPDLKRHMLTHTRDKPFVCDNRAGFTKQVSVGTHRGSHVHLDKQTKQDP